jgi:hypothetical protein
MLISPSGVDLPRRPGQGWIKRRHYGAKLIASIRFAAKIRNLDGESGPSAEASLYP